MSRDDSQRIADILEAAAEIADILRQGDQPLADRRTLTRALERLLEIIGEAATVLSDDTKARFPEVDWRGLARLRTVLAHHYHRSDPTLVWSYATEDVPELVRQLAD